MEKHRRSGSQEFTSRFIPLDSTPASRTLSPHRRKSLPLDASSSASSARKHRTNSSSEDVASAPTRGLWPSSSRRSSTLADHLGNDRLINLSHRSPSPAPTDPDPPNSISRQRSSSEFRRFDDDQNRERHVQVKDKEDRKLKKSSSKENHLPVGGSMRYIGSKILFPRSGKPDSPPSSSFAAARISVDENALASSRRRSDFLADIPSSESDRSDSSSNKIPTPRAPRPNRHKNNHHQDRNQETRSAEMNPTAKVVPPAIRRTSSGSAWALSPGRRSGSPPLLDGGARPAAAGVRSFSSLRPPSPGKGRGSVGNFLNLGLDLFRRKSGSGSAASPTPTPTPSSSFGNGSPTGNSAAVGEVGHQFKMSHNRLIQWRFVNARSHALTRAKHVIAQKVLMSGWAGMSKLQASVVQKRLQLHKEKLGHKLSTMLSHQVRSLERWTDMERQHASALSATKEHLHAAVCRVPLIEGAKVESQHLTAALRQANDLALTIGTTTGILSPMAQKTVPLLSELAQVVAKEKSQLEECFELIGLLSSLEIQEQSLKCHLIQLNSMRTREQHQAQGRNIIATS